MGDPRIDYNPEPFEIDEVFKVVEFELGITEHHKEALTELPAIHVGVVGEDEPASNPQRNLLLLFPDLEAVQELADDLNILLATERKRQANTEAGNESGNKEANDT